MAIDSLNTFTHAVTTVAVTKNVLVNQLLATDAKFTVTVTSGDVTIKLMQGDATDAMVEICTIPKFTATGSATIAVETDKKYFGYVMTPGAGTVATVDVIVGVDK